MSINSELASIVGGLFLSLCAFSLLFGDNYLFRLGAVILSAAVSAYACVLLIQQVFYPMLTEAVPNGGGVNLSASLRLAAVLIAAVLLFCKAYAGGKNGGRGILILVLAASAAVMVFGVVSGTIPAFVRGIAAPYRISVLSEAEKNSAWYWVNAATVFVCAIFALLYTRHYKPGTKKAKQTYGDLFGEILIGFAFGALTAAVFLTAAQILTGNIAGILENVRLLLK